MTHSSRRSAEMRPPAPNNSLICAGCAEPVEPAELLELIVKGRERPLYSDTPFPRLRPPVAHRVFHARCLRAITAVAALIADDELADEPPQGRQSTQGRQA